MGRQARPYNRQPFFRCGIGQFFSHPLNREAAGELWLATLSSFNPHAGIYRRVLFI